MSVGSCTAHTSSRWMDHWTECSERRSAQARHYHSRRVSSNAHVTAAMTTTAMQFDARALSDDELVVLESTLRVQLAVAKHERVQQVTLALGSALLTGGISSLLACPSIVCSTVQRRKCKRRHGECCRELAARNVALAPIREVKFAKRALALSIASGLTCCVLGVALDVLVDGAVLQVVSFFFSTYFEDRMAQGTTALLQRRAADLVGRDHVYMVTQPQALFGGSAASAAAAAPTTAPPSRSEGLAGLPHRLWKSASWSFSTSDVQATIRDAKRAFRHRRSLREGAHTADADADDACAPHYTSLFPPSSASAEARRRCEHATLFQCCIVLNAGDTTMAASSASALDIGNAANARVELVRNEAFSLFGDCYVVHMQPVGSSDAGAGAYVNDDYGDDDDGSLFPCAATPMRRSDRMAEPCRDDDETSAADVPIARVIPWSGDGHGDVSDAAELFPRSRAGTANKGVLFAGDAVACAFWDGIWNDDGSTYEDECLLGVPEYNSKTRDATFTHSEARDSCEKLLWQQCESAPEAWDTGDDNDDNDAWLDACHLLSHNRPRGSPSVIPEAESTDDAFALFGASMRLCPSAALDDPATKIAAMRNLPEQYNLFG